MGVLRKRTDGPILSLLVPGRLETPTGGYIYDRHIVEGLRGLGWRVDVHSLDATFPMPTPLAVEHARTILQALPSGRIVVIDGLALGGLSTILEPEAERLCPVALIHHPLALETGLDIATASALRKAEQDSLSLTRRVVVTSRWTARAVEGYGVSSTRIRVVEPGVDSGAIRLLDNRAKSETVNLLCVATVTPRKGHAVLVEALARIRERNWRLRCAGSLTRDPATAKAVREQIGALKLEDKIELLGEIDDVALSREYATCDAFVLASFMEGYGMALAEALAHGLPIVATRAGAIQDTVPAECSLLVEPGDAIALADALAAIVDADTRNRLTLRARAASQKVRTWETAVQEFFDVLKDLNGSCQ